jgi:hypothetical protein
MRDEAKARREAEGVSLFIPTAHSYAANSAQKHTFNLQAQPDKIAKFEEPLKHKTSAYWPNFLGARFSDDWERKTRRGRTAAGGEEDGEVR